MATLAFVLDTFGANLTLYTNCVTLFHAGRTVYFKDNEGHGKYKLLEEFFCSRYPIVRAEPAQAYSGLDNFPDEKEATSTQVDVYEIAQMIDDLVGSRYEGFRTHMSIDEFYENGQEKSALVGRTGLVFHDEIAAREYFDASKTSLPEDAYLQPGSRVISFSVSIISEILGFIAKSQGASSIPCACPGTLPEVVRKDNKYRTVYTEEQSGDEDNTIEQAGEKPGFYDIYCAIEDFNLCWNKSYYAEEYCRLMEKGLIAGVHVGRRTLNKIWKELPDSAPLDIFICEAAKMVKKTLENRDHLKQRNSLAGAVSMIIQRQQQLTLENGHLYKKKIIN